MDNPGLLSQNEIDSLLAALANGDAEATDAPQVAPGEVPVDNTKRYDFRRPDRFSKEQMRALRMIHETWARRASVSLSAYLRTSVEMGLSDIDQGMYTSLAQQLPDRGIYYVIGLVPLAGHFTLQMNMQLALTIVDRLMGGPGIVHNTERRLTELETELLRGTTERLLADLSEAWGNVATIRPRIEDVSVNLLLAPIALPTDAVVWASFEVRAKGATSSMMLALPYPVLKPIAGQLSPYTWATSNEGKRGGEGNRHRKDVQDHLVTTRLPVSVLLGSVDLDLSELANLRPGDVLPLDVPVDGLCPVLVNGRRKYLGRVGLQRRKLAVQLEKLAEEAVPCGPMTPDAGQENR